MFPTWTDHQINMLRQLWKQGKTASEIATILGCGLTRNAIVGKAHRLGLTGRPNPIKRLAPGQEPKNPYSARARQKTKQSIRLSPIKMKAAPPPPPPRLAIPKRSDKSGCRYPIGDPRAAGFHFCLIVPVEPGHPYCAEHCSICYRQTAHL